MSIKDEIIESIISLVTSIADLDDSTKGLLLIRKFEDSVRPTKSYEGESCGNNKLDLYGEITVSEIEQIESCVGSYIDENGYTQACASNTYEAKVDLDFVDCGAFDFASDFLCKISLPALRNSFLNEGLKINSHTNLIDVTELEGGAVSRERVTFTLYVRYACIAEYQVQEVIMSLVKGDCCGVDLFPIEFIN